MMESSNESRIVLSTPLERALQENGLTNRLQIKISGNFLKSFETDVTRSAFNNEHEESAR